MIDVKQGEATVGTIQRRYSEFRLLYRKFKDYIHQPFPAKTRCWRKLFVTDEEVSAERMVLLQQFLEELIAATARHEVPLRLMPELYQFLGLNVRSLDCLIASEEMHAYTRRETELMGELEQTKSELKALKAEMAAVKGC